MSAKIMQLTVQKWGNSLAVRIPVPIAMGAHFHVGTKVEAILEKGTLSLKAIDDQVLTLEERLDRFDPKKHSGEAMAVKAVGVEKL